MGKSLAPSLVEAIKADFHDNLSFNKIALKRGVDARTAIKICKNLVRNTDQKIDEKGLWLEEENTATYSCVTDKPIKTLAQAIEVAEVDLDVWYPERFEIANWTVVIKNKEHKPVQTQQYRVKVYLKRILKKSLSVAHNMLLDRMKEYAPKYPKTTYAKRSDGCLAVMGLFDAHFGKLAWDQETGNSYDIKIAEKVYTNAVDDLMSNSAGRKISRWLLPIGNDFYHMDNSHNTTFAGTPQDVDGRYAKIIMAGEMAVISAIEKMVAIAPIDVFWIPGNHDLTTSFHLARTIEAWFRNHQNVTVNATPTPRKYYHWGVTLLGMTHGNEEKKDILPSLMATEKPIEWSNSKCREWLVGHDHRSRKWVTQPVDTYEGTTVRTLRSLAGTDLYHFKKGYIGASPASEIYYYTQKDGYISHSIAYTRT